MTQQTTTRTATRMCGTRYMGGIYFETATMAMGIPIEYYMIDPPYQIDAHALGLSAQGQTLIPADDGSGTLVWHALDWIGASYYPHVADYIEETRCMGVSRRVSTVFDFSKVSPKSRLLLAHPKAVILNAEDYHPRHPLTRYHQTICPKAVVDYKNPFGEVRNDHVAQVFPQHTGQKNQCAGMFWEDYDPEYTSLHTSGQVVRTLPSCTFSVVHRQPNFVPEYALGIFLSVPITNIVVIKDTLGQRDAIALDILKKSQTTLPYSLVST